MWHTLFVMTGMEDHVMEFLNQRVSRHSRDAHYKVFHPTRKLAHLNRGKKTIVSKALFPGYLFFKTEDTDYFKSVLRDCTKHLTILRGIDFSFETMRQDEIDGIMLLLSESGEIDFSGGIVEHDKVRIVSGPLMNYCGEIIKINKRECKAKIQLNFMGKEITPYVGLNVLDKIADEELLNARDFHFARK